MEYDFVKEPEHYKQYSLQAREIMEKVFGTDAMALYSEMTAFKYRLRMGFKPNSSIEQDFAKEAEYLKQAKHFKNKLNNGSSV